MRLIFLLALKNLTSKATRTICSILAISMGLGTAIAIFTLDYNTILSQRMRLKRHYGEPDLELKPLNKYRADIAGLGQKLLDIQGIKALTPIFFKSTNIYPVKTKPLNILLCGLTPKGNERFNAYRLVAGRDLPEGNRRVILLTLSFAQNHNIALGNYINFKISTTKPKKINTKCFGPERKSIERKVQVVSEKWAKFKVVGFIAREHLGGRNNGQVGIVPFYAGVEFFRSLFPFFWAQTSPEYPLDNLKDDLSSLVSVSKPSFAIIGESSLERAFRNGVHICGLFALGLGLFVVFNSFSMSLMERIKQIGLLRLVGATSGQICLVLLAEAAIIALIANALGLILGLGLTKILITFRITTLGLGKPIYSFHVPWDQVMGIMALGIIMDFGGAMYPMLKARKISPMRAIFPREGEMSPKTGKASKSVILAIVSVCLVLLYFFISPYLAVSKQIRILSILASAALYPQVGDS